jgi:hypothetical protein
MVEDFLATPRIELLAEVAEDRGDARALSADFDRLVAPIMQRAEIGTTDAVRAQREKPHRAGYPIGPGRSGDAHDADLATNPATYIVEAAEGRSAEEARTNYQGLQMKFPFILKARDPLILSSERVGEGGGRRWS